MSTPCRFFGKPQGCRWGETCRFSHSMDGQQQNNESAASCRFFASSGGCRFGSNCYYKHDKQPPSEVENTEPKVVKPPEDPPGADNGDEFIVFGFLRELVKEHKLKFGEFPEETDIYIWAQKILKI